MPKIPEFQNDIPDEKYYYHLSFLLDLSERGSIAAVAFHRNVSSDCVKYHLSICNSTFGLVYEVPPGGHARLTRIGWELIAKFKPMALKTKEFFDFVALAKELKPHARCPHAFPPFSRVYNKDAPFPRIKKVGKKLVLRCNRCKTRVMILLKPCVKEWLKTNDMLINGPDPLFEIL